MSDIPAVYNLKEYQQQLDADGVMVGVSREALDEALAHIAALESRLAAAEADSKIEALIEVDWLEQKGIDRVTGRYWMTPRMQRNAKRLQLRMGAVDITGRR